MAAQPYAPPTRQPLLSGWVTKGYETYRKIRLRNMARFLGNTIHEVTEWYLDFKESTSMDRNLDLELYILVRSRQPDFAVDTGVRRGWTTSAILRALDHNHRGRLTSIDLPMAPGPKERTWLTAAQPGMTGCEIPEYLRSRWTLVIGDAKAELPKLDGYDFFFHDSDHSYQHQRFEYETALCHLTPGGILASDDIDWSGAWDEVVKKARRVVTWPPVRRQRGAAIFTRIR